MVSTDLGQHVTEASETGLLAFGLIGILMSTALNQPHVLKPERALNANTRERIAAPRVQGQFRVHWASGKENHFDHETAKQ